MVKAASTSTTEKKSRAPRKAKAPLTTRENLSCRVGRDSCEILEKPC
jgi:hypothetical protein